ncbi:hypothetical protein [Limimonas halophila]|nr:hypothetical protein [Limimonas halophila]
MKRQIEDAFEKAKPVIGGALGGAAVVTIAGFAAGWVVTSGTLKAEVKDARVSALATVCAQEAKAHWLDEGKKLAALDGYTNDKREKLAESFSMSVRDWNLESSVQEHCNEELQEAIDA